MSPWYWEHVILIQSRIVCFEFCCVCKEGLLFFFSTTGTESRVARYHKDKQVGGANAYPLMWQVPDVDLSWNSLFKLLRALTFGMKSSVFAQT